MLTPKTNRRLNLEALEDRLAPAIYVSNSNHFLLRASNGVVGTNQNNSAIVSPVAGGYRVSEAGLPAKVYTSANVWGGDVYFG